MNFESESAMGAGANGDPHARVNRVDDRHEDAGRVDDLRPTRQVISFSRSGDSPLPFPTHVLPEPIASLVRIGARALGVPEDLVAVPFLPLAGGTIGPSHCLEVKLGYIVRPGLWTTSVARSGVGKTPALNVARAPISRLQARLNVPSLSAASGHRLFTTDTTFEALVRLLEASNGLTVIHDELTSWIDGFDQYRGGKGADRQHYLSLWSSDELTIDRVGQKKVPVHIQLDCPIVSITGGIQPGMRHKLAAEAGLDDGLLARVLFSWPDAPVMTWTEDAVPESVIESVTDVLEALRGTPRDNPVHLDAAARRDWVDFYNWAVRAGSESEGPMSSVLLKMHDQVLRLALILHCLAHPHDPTAVELDQETMRGALELGDYFIEHAARVLHGVEAMGGNAARVRAMLEPSDGPVNRSAITKALGGHLSANALTTALEQLEREELVRRGRREPGPRGGAPAETWEWIGERENELTSDSGAG